MKITVLNGSPKGDKSITKKYVNFIEKMNGDHNFHYINVGNQISRLERDRDFWNVCMSRIDESDLILFAFPLYVYLVPSQLKRFIELAGERGGVNAFTGKYTAVITTSINFFDHAAHNYMEAVCNDWNMKYIEGISFAMQDLFDEKKRSVLIGFGINIIESAKQQRETPTTNTPLRWTDFAYRPELSSLATREAGNEKNILLLTDNKNSGSNIEKMCETLKSCLPGIKEMNIHDIEMKAGCQGCLRCGWENKCLFENSDEFTDFYNSHILPADIIIYAGKIEDRYLSSRWKMFFDRRFFNTHKPTMTGKQIGFLIEGPLAQLSNLKEILEANVQWEKANLIGFVTDECEESDRLTRLIEAFADKAVRFSEMSYIKPSTFLGVGGVKIFRDDIYGGLRFPFQADHKYYKQNGFYDFPPNKGHHNLGFSRIMIFICTLFPAFRKMMYEKMLKDKMVEPYEKLLARV